MSAYIGFDRRIRLAWLDEVAGQMLRDPNPAAVRSHLHNALAPELQGVEARTKTITLLSRIWATVPQAPHLRDEALGLLPILLPDERLWLHWGLTLLAFPFFRDVAATVGRLLRIQSQCSVGQVTDRVIAAWGERTTLVRATQRVLRSCVDWGVLREDSARGVYQASEPCRTTTIPLRDWFVEAAVRAHNTDGLPISELVSLPENYPFVLNIQPYELTRMVRFDVQQQGNGVVMVYPGPINQPTLPDRATNAPAMASTVVFSGKIVTNKSS
jgi:hypothetical protein